MQPVENQAGAARRCERERDTAFSTVETMSPRFPTRALFAHLLDDAAVFPPGNFPLDEAIERRARRRGTPASDFVGPLLVPPALVDDALADGGGLVIGVVGRAGTAIADVVAAGERVTASPSHALAGLEVPAVDGWRDALSLGVPLAVEVPAGPSGVSVLPDLASSPLQVIAKLRTGSSSANPVPSSADVAQFIGESVRLGLPFKLTGGLHHAVTSTVTADGRTEDQFGFLNILLATGAALDGGDIAAQLERRDTSAIAADIAEFSEARAVNVRNSFTSYGCCDVLDPINDLATLGLIED